MNKILIVVDMQNGFMTKPNYLELSTKINKFLEQSNYENIILTKFINIDNSLYETKLHWFALRDNQSQDFSIKFPNNAIIFEKFGYGLTNKQIDYIKSLNVDQIDICGLQTDACVYAIAFQMFDNEIYPNILINYCQTSPERNEMAKQMLIHQFGKVDEIL